jgi:putative CocE/NonD family hydrolase
LIYQFLKVLDLRPCKKLRLVKVTRHSVIALFLGSIFGCGDNIIIDEDIQVAMRDGVHLSTDIYLPRKEGPFPVILCRVPYGTQSDYVFQPAVGRFFAENGFVYVAQNVRGRFGSEGIFNAYIDGQEVPDAYDTIEWIVAQDWSDGNVGVMGESYYGYTTLAAAASGHPAIKAISPANITLAREKQTSDGAFPLQASGLWTLDMDDVENGQYQDTGQVDLYHLPLITMGEAHGLRDVLWRERVSGYSIAPFAAKSSALEGYQSVRVPGLHFGGWYDSFTRGSIAIWDGVSKNSDSNEARDMQWLVMGPWDHDGMSVHLSGATPATNIGSREIGSAAVSTYGDTLLEFFNYFLKDEENGFNERPRVRYFNIGDNEWRYSDQWPVTNMGPNVLFFHSEGDAASSVDGVLNSVSPEYEPSDTFNYDPGAPVDITAETGVWSRAAGLADRKTLLGRDDVLTYQTPPLEQDLEVTGPISVKLYASSSAPDTDFTAALVDVYPDGYSLLIQEGILRASFRNNDGNVAPIEPHQVYKFSIDLWSTSYTIPTGHSVRVEISSSNFPRFARNLNNGEPFGMSDRVEVAEQVIYHTDQYPSQLLLPSVAKN